MTKEIIYVGDPMCSWCYGFTGVIRELREKYSDRAKLSLVMGGLRPDGTHVVDQAYSDFLKDHWREIGERTGQPFNLAILDDTGWIYDTEKACRAVAAFRIMQPGGEWAYFARAQQGFYRDNHDPKDPASFARLAEGFGIEPESFLRTYLGSEASEATQRDFEWARSVGVSSFPTVVLRDELGLAALTIGYRPLALLEPALNRWLER
jgi:putative protein-disulfide isomerase